MRCFLYAVLNMIKHSEKEECEELEKHVNSGIATYLSEEYKEYFSNVHPDAIKEADRYFQDYRAAFDDADRKYGCEEDEGLYLLISIALNMIN